MGLFAKVPQWVYPLVPILAVVAANQFYFGWGPTRQSATTEYGPSVDTAAVEPESVPVPFHVPQFQLKNQNGIVVSDSDLRGKISVASFALTGCTSTCAIVGDQMGKIQRTVSDHNVRLVTFCVDSFPLTTSFLHSYSLGFQADDQRWSILGGEVGPARRVAENLHAMSPASKDPSHDSLDSLIPRPWIFLIDRDGLVIHVYDALKPGSDDVICRDISDLLQASEIKRSPPTAILLYDAAH